ncbi:MAG: hypothetical protein FH753_10420 [Firmicutes bacterium]|nr:hypothetical protein [Bacillota bacterium]
MADVYIKAIEKLVKEDQGLNSDIKYIAIEMRTLKGINKEDDRVIKEYIEKKYMKVKDVSLKDLINEGEFDEKNLYLRNGILIRVDNINKFTSDEISFEASKYRSGKGEIGFLFKFNKKDSKWKLVESRMLWIS